jgi:hypothetical protein
MTLVLYINVNIVMHAHMASPNYAIREAAKLSSADSRLSPLTNLTHAVGTLSKIARIDCLSLTGTH